MFRSKVAARQTGVAASEQASGEHIMNIEHVQPEQRRTFLQMLWWKSRRSAGGHNDAAERADVWADYLSAVSILSSLIVFTLAVAQGVGQYFDARLAIPFSFIAAMAAAIVMGIGFIQAAREDRAKAVEHRLASAEFDALARDIEALAFEAPDDPTFIQLGARFDQLRRQSRRVPERVWRKSSMKFDEHIDAARNKLLGEG